MPAAAFGRWDRGAAPTQEWGARPQPVLCLVLALLRWKPRGWGLVSVPLNSPGPQSRPSSGQMWLLAATLASSWYRAELATFLGGLGRAEGSLAEVGLSLPGWSQSIRRQGRRPAPGMVP